MTPIRLETVFPTLSICSLQLTNSSRVKPRHLTEVATSIVIPLNVSMGGLISLAWGLRKCTNLVFFKFRVSLFKRKYSAIMIRSLERFKTRTYWCREQVQREQI